MDKNKIQLNYSNKIKLFKKLNKFYYEKSQPMVDDRDYDQLKKDILELENKYEYLNSDFSPSKTIEFTIGFSVTLITNSPSAILTCIFEKKFVSYNFLINKFTSSAL